MESTLLMSHPATPAAAAAKRPGGDLPALVLSVLAFTLVQTSA